MQTLDAQTLEAKLKDTESGFNRVQAEIRKIELEEQGLAQRKAELNVELFRYQGEHRILSDLLGKKPDEQKVEAPKPEEAKQQ